MATKKIVSKEALERWQQRCQMIACADFSVSGTSEVQAERIRRAKKDYAFFVETYFPHLAKSKCAKFQLQAAAYMLKNRNARAVFEWPRGSAKSTHNSLLIPLWLKIQDQRTFNVMVLVSKSEEAADRLLGDLQAELQYNHLYIKDFGKQVVDGSWADGEFKTQDGCFFLSIGRGQSPRGLKDRGKRPDYIVIDDIDDDEMSRNPKRVKDAFDWCLSALIGAMDVGRGRFVLVGNRISKKSVLALMVERPGIFHIQINILDKNGLLTWPENFTYEEVKSLREFVGERRFQKEFMNNPLSEGAVFEEKYIRYGDMLPLKSYRSLICYTDPSFKSSNKNDFKATMLVGKTKEGVFHVIKAYADQTTVSNMVQWHYDIDQWVDGRVPVIYYMEANFLQDLILKEFKIAGDACGKHIPVRGDKRKKPDKFARIEAMQPFFERALILFNKSEEKSIGMMQLKEQLLSFEKGSNAHDDAPDALEGAIYLLNKRNMTTTATYRSGSVSNRRF